MLQALRLISGAILAMGVVAALAEVDGKWTLPLLTGGFAGLLAWGVAQGRVNNDRYSAAVLASLQPGETSSVSVVRPLMGLLFLFAFLSVGGLCVYFNHPWPIAVGGGVTAIAGWPYWSRQISARHAAWQKFAEQHELQYQPGRVTDRLDNPRINGRFRGRDLRMTIVDQQNSSQRRRRAVFVAEVSTTICDVTFCVDDLRLDSSTPDLARQIFDWRDLSEKIRATDPLRISLFEESLSFHFPRVPATLVELRFHTDLIIAVVDRMERSNV